MKAAFCTLGCKVNQYDTEVMREQFVSAGFECVDFTEKADVYLINTCTVTGTGDKKSRQMVSRAHALAPHAKIVVTGCYSQRAPDEVLALPGVDLVIGTKDREQIVKKVLALKPGEKHDAVSPFKKDDAFEEFSATSEDRTRAHLKIQDGCDRYCTYCIIPYARGPVRSRPLESVRVELEKLANAGYKEVVLTGIHLMSYGKEFNKDIADAVACANGIDGLERIRLGSLEPQLLSAKFVDMVARDERVCRQFHLSLQSGSDTVLKRMARRYDTDRYMECVEQLRTAMPDCAITTDIIVGFPGETDEEFEETMAFAKRARLSRIHVFPYSRRQGTPAAKMPDQISNKQKSQRATRLIALAEQLEDDYAQKFTGAEVAILVETLASGRAKGYTDTYISVEADGANESDIGQIRRVSAQSAKHGALIGSIIR